MPGEGCTVEAEQREQGIDGDPCRQGVVVAELGLVLLARQREPFHEPDGAVHARQAAAAVVDAPLGDLDAEGRFSRALWSRLGPKRTENHRPVIAAGRTIASG